MSSAPSRVVGWGSTRTDLDQLSGLHRELAALSKVSSFLIYGQPSFSNYLNSVVDSPDHAFTRLAGRGGERTLCHLRVFGGVTFLNNIYLAPELRGEGRGSLLLAESVRQLGASPFSVMELDAFESNVQAIAWYRRLGFREVGSTLWNWFKVPAGSTTSTEIVMSPDESGFVQIYVDQLRIGTRLDRHAVLTTTEFVKLLGSDHFDDLVVRSGENTFSAEGTLLETSVRLRATSSTFLKELHH